MRGEEDRRLRNAMKKKVRLRVVRELDKMVAHACTIAPQLQE